MCNTALLPLLPLTSVHHCTAAPNTCAPLHNLLTHQRIIISCHLYTNSSCKGRRLCNYEGSWDVYHAHAGTHREVNHGNVMGAVGFRFRF